MGWYFFFCGTDFPPLLFYLLYLFTGINLMVERYLILISLASYLLDSCHCPFYQALSMGKDVCDRLCALLCNQRTHSLLFQEGSFFPGDAGESQWRETFGALNGSAFQSSLLLFQSPYIEADQLDYSPNTPLFDYLSAPMLSFHIQDARAPFELLPHHWRTETAMQEKFNATD